ncbi:hypothetical protein [Tessaracoccus coleopterorum]|uniref:hypothetical protein n=1 Tax=Tessaracoccus coleopterorum TaxID=2714950 RepID=UPI0018D4018C|nr:hypothetical protein [Tessaracoccus coleopterorum]
MGSRLHRGEVELWVRDEGVGIPGDKLGLVRERFGRASTDEQGQGWASASWSPSSAPIMVVWTSSPSSMRDPRSP